MPYNTLPLNTGGSIGSFPLSPAPYFSRVEDQELDVNSTDHIGDNASNTKKYQMLAFRPGFALQASELNEIQEHFQMQLTLSITMMHNWISSGLGTHWGAWDSDSVSGGSLTAPIDVPNTGIGVGGYINNGQTIHNSQYAITAPGWRGSCPLHPFHCSFQSGDNFNKFPVTVQKFSLPVPRYEVSFWPGWWLVEVGGWWDGTIDAPPEDNSGVPISGMKHWVYLDGIDPYTPLYTLSINDSDEDKEIPMGFTIVSKYYSCCQEDADLNCDPTLADNANGGIPNDVACGASRYAIEVIGANFVDVSGGDWGNHDDKDSDFAAREELSLVCTLNPARKTLRYMNNLLIYREIANI